VDLQHKKVDFEIFKNNAQRGTIVMLYGLVSNVDISGLNLKFKHAFNNYFVLEKQNIDIKPAMKS
jgi:hypothetical protein